MKRVVIGGIGNVMLGDDGAGPYVARLLEAEYEFDAGVRVVDLGLPGLGLIAEMLASDLLLLVDAVQDGTAPGTVTRYTREQICSNAPPTVDPHSPALTASLMLAELSGEPMGEVIAIGITGENYAAGQPLSGAVRAGAAEAIGMILEELDAHGIAYRAKEPPAVPDIWWERPAVGAPKH